MKAEAGAAVPPSGGAKKEKIISNLCQKQLNERLLCSESLILPVALVPSVAIAFEGFGDGSLVRVNECCPLSLQSALNHRLPTVEIAVVASTARPSRPSSLILARVTLEDVAGCWATAEAFAATRGTVAFALVAVGTLRSCQSSG